MPDLAFPTRERVRSAEETGRAVGRRPLFARNILPAGGYDPAAAGRCPERLNIRSTIGFGTYKRLGIGADVIFNGYNLFFESIMVSLEYIVRLRELLARPAQNIVIVSHTNPDGDAVGSSLAWREALLEMGHRVTCIVPNKYPYFLDWMTGIENLVLFKTDEAGVARRAVEESDLIFFLDFNAVSRLEGLSEVIESNTTARRILIDHHLSPGPGFDLMFSCTGSSSTSFLIYRILEKMLGTQAITRSMAESLYVGMMTGTWPVRCWSKRASTFPRSTTMSITPSPRAVPGCSAMRSTARWR